MAENRGLWDINFGNSVDSNWFFKICADICGGVCTKSKVGVFNCPLKVTNNMHGIKIAFKISQNYI